MDATWKEVSWCRVQIDLLLLILQFCDLEAVKNGLSFIDSINRTKTLFFTKKILTKKNRAINFTNIMVTEKKTYT